MVHDSNQDYRDKNETLARMGIQILGLLNEGCS